MIVFEYNAHNCRVRFWRRPFLAAWIMFLETGIDEFRATSNERGIARQTFDVYHPMERRGNLGVIPVERGAGKYNNVIIIIRLWPSNSVSNRVRCTWCIYIYIYIHGVFFKVFDVVIYLFIFTFLPLHTSYFAHTSYAISDIAFRLCVTQVFLCFSGAETILGLGVANADTAPVTGGIPTTIVTVVWTRSD